VSPIPKISDSETYSELDRSTALLQPVQKSLHFATVAELQVSVRRYGCLKDQDRIVTNAYCRHDHGLKGAKVRLKSIYALTFTD
jgi:hypothetical protein